MVKAPGYKLGVIYVVSSNLTLLNIFNSYNYVFFKNFINLILKISTSNFNNFIFFDNTYNSINPINNYIFGFKNLFVYKNFFFFDFKKFTYKSWLVKYDNFLKNFNINFIIITDYLYFRKFFNLFKEINIITAALIPINYVNLQVDFPIYYNSLLQELEKFFFINIFTHCYFLSLNYKNYKNKINFLKLFYNFSIFLL